MSRFARTFSVLASRVSRACSLACAPEFLSLAEPGLLHSHTPNEPFSVLLPSTASVSPSSPAEGLARSSCACGCSAFSFRVILRLLQPAAV
jgi:hypothetical protein